MKKLMIALIASTALLLGSSSSSIVTYEEAKTLHVQPDVVFIDARPPKLYKKGTIMGAMNLPFKQFDSRANLLPADKQTKIVSFCNGPKCKLSHKLAAKLNKMGYSDVVVYQGGYPEWKEKKAPLMGLLKECKAQNGTYKLSEAKQTTINGTTLYKGAEEGMVDQRWFAELMNQGNVPENVVLVDVRRTEDFEKGHFKNALGLPFDMEKSSMDFDKIPTDKIVVFYCYTGILSLSAWQESQAKGLDVSKMFYVDANVKCQSDCVAEPNEDL